MGELREALQSSENHQIELLESLVKDEKKLHSKLANKMQEKQEAQQKEIKRFQKSLEEKEEQRAMLLSKNEGLQQETDDPMRESHEKEMC